MRSDICCQRDNAYFVRSVCTFMSCRDCSEKVGVVAADLKLVIATNRMMMMEMMNAIVDKRL